MTQTPLKRDLCHLDLPVHLSKTTQQNQRKELSHITQKIAPEVFISCRQHFETSQSFEAEKSKSHLSFSNLLCSLLLYLDNAT